MGRIVYLDNAATSPMRNEIVYALIPYFLTEYGNASASYSLGREAKEELENCRNVIGKMLNCQPEGIYFTSGGTESDNMLIKGLARANKGNHIITSSIEHPAVLNTCKELEKEGYVITYLPVNEIGKVNIEQLKKEITEDTCLISVMMANNEVGTIQPIKEITDIAHEHNIVVHTDMVQATGHIPIDIKDIGVDSFSCSGHKFGSPKGVGIAYIKPGVECEPFIFGGGQEKGMRSGTENIPSIVGMTMALAYSCKTLSLYTKKMDDLREKFLTNLKGVNLKINSFKKYSIPNILNISFPNIDGENLKLYLDTKGICVSNGSACHSGDVEPSHVLAAMNLSEENIKGAIRISFGDNSCEDIDYVTDCIKEYLKEVKRNGIDAR